MGHAMEYLLGRAHELAVWTRHPGPGRTAPDLAAAAASADFTILCTPAPALAGLARQIRDALPAGACVLTMAKGLDDDGRPPARILAAAGIARLAVLYGPMIAEEIRAGRPAWAGVAASPDAALPGVLALFAGSGLHLAPATDMTGLSWCAVLKNVYAIVLGAAEALALGDNARGWLLSAAVEEMASAVAHLGGEAATARGLAGLGDLVTTATSAGSHHRAVGAALARGETGALTGEGVHTLRVVRERRLIDLAACPLVCLAEDMVRDPAGAAGRLAAYVENGGAAARKG